MEIIATIFAACLQLLNMPIPIFGFEISFWQILIFSVLAGLLAKLIWGLIE